MLFLLGGGEKDIVQNQAIAGRIGVQRQVGRRVAHKVAIVLGVVAAQEGPGALAVLAVQVAHLAKFLVFSHYQGAALHRLAAEGRRLAHKAVDDARVVLRQHRRHPVPLGRKLEKREEIVLFVDRTGARAVVDVDGRNLVLGRIGADAEILE